MEEERKDRRKKEPADEMEASTQKADSESSARAGRRARRARRRAKRRIAIGIASGVLALLCILIVFMGRIIYDWISEKNKTPVSDDAVQLAEDISERNYTREELEAYLTAALQHTQEEAVLRERERILGGIAERFESGSSVVKALRPFYEDHLVVASGGKYNFVPINNELQKNGFLAENLRKLESGEWQYAEGDSIISHKGIDVSQHQGEIDWSLVAASGVEFAFLRVGFRGYGSGKLVVDEQFENNIRGAAENGIPVGVYFFSQAVNETEIAEEVSFVLEQIKPYKVQLPVVYDVERVEDSGARMNQITVEERTRLTALFCRMIEEAGYKPMIYHNMEMGVMLLNLSELEQYDKWFAYYSDDMYYPYAYKVWQYSEKGKIDGITGSVDLNMSFAPWE